MKKWYQYRCEEVEFPPDVLFPWDYLMFPQYSERFKRFLYCKAIKGELFWQFTANFSDWRAVYGKDGGMKDDDCGA